MCSQKAKYCQFKKDIECCNSVRKPEVGVLGNWIIIGSLICVKRQQPVRPLWCLRACGLSYRSGHEVRLTESLTDVFGLELN